MKGLSATNPVRTVPVCTHSSDKDDLDLLLFQSIKVDWPGLRFNVSEHGKGISRLTSFGLYLYLRTIRSGDSQGCVYNCSLMMFDICSVPALFCSISRTLGWESLDEPPRNRAWFTHDSIGGLSGLCFTNLQPRDVRLFRSCSFYLCSSTLFSLLS
jgi:hypothetical protein